MEQSNNQNDTSGIESDLYSYSLSSVLLLYGGEHCGTVLIISKWVKEIF